jgi:glyoxylase-like metal-dependent hydrolase (beta-lactamase superfamily II)
MPQMGTDVVHNPCRLAFRPPPPHMRLIDLKHLGRERVIGAWMVGDVLVDPGPQSCIDTLLEELGGEAPRVIALTHIHLDHAGATGSLLQHFPQAEVWVHERGAPHLIDPSKLLASAGRLYGENMDRLWGEVLPVPAKRVRILAGGESLDGFQVAYTPGHASHHVCYLHDQTRTAFCGDLTGVRIGQQAPVVAPTPPPDIDLPAWRASLDLVEAWRPDSLVATHFGRYGDVGEHLARIRKSLQDMERWARSGDEAQFEQALSQQIAAEADAELAPAYGQAMPPGQSFAGLRRHLQRA